MFGLREMLRLDSGMDVDLYGDEQDYGVLMMSFSMRKLVGFRLKAEYDTRVILLCSLKEVCIITYSLTPTLAKESMANSRPMSANFNQNEDEECGNGGGLFEHDDDVTPSDGAGFRQAEVVLKWKANSNEVVRYANFVDDERP